MWSYGEVNGYRWEAKVYDNPSGWGIADGRISKLFIHDAEGNCAYSYDRGPSMGDTISESDLLVVLAAIDPGWDFTGAEPATEEDEDMSYDYEPLELGGTLITTSVTYDHLGSNTTDGRARI